MVKYRAVTRAIAISLSLPLSLSAQGSNPAPSDTTAVRLSAVPEIVGPGVVSTIGEEFKATSSPDRQVLMYVVTDHLFRRMTIVQSRRQGGGWATPGVAPFSGIWRDGDPAYAPDGRSIWFISNRPLPGDSAGSVRHDFNLWVVRKGADGKWGAPIAQDRNINTGESEFAPSVTASGDLYFSRGDHIFFARKAGDGYQNPVPLPIDGGDPAISSDGNTLVFDRDRTPGDPDLYVSCQVDGRWTAPRRFLEPVNSSAQEGDPSISADGRTLYFFSTRFTPVPVRTPRATRATYQELRREVDEVVYNGSRNLFQVDLSPMTCPLSSRGQ